MAKQQAPAGDVAGLAEQLFVQNWQAASGYTAESVAQKCIAAAEEFYKAMRSSEKPSSSER